MSAATTEQITIRVDPEAAKLYRSAPESLRRKLDLLLSLRLSEAARSPESLGQIMERISLAARQRGLTADALRALLEE